MSYILDFRVSIEKGFFKLKGGGGGEGIDFGCAERTDLAILQSKQSGYFQQYLL